MIASELVACLERGVGERSPAIGDGLPPEVLRRGEILVEEGLEAQIENELVFAAVGMSRVRRVLPHPLDILLQLGRLGFSECRRKRSGKSEGCGELEVAVHVR